MRSCLKEPNNFESSSDSQCSVSSSSLDDSSISDCQESSSNNAEKSVFGQFQDTRNWIECESKSIPGRIYFFNLRTLCSTWVRPVSKNVQLQRFYSQSRVYDNVMPDVGDPPMCTLSENEGGYSRRGDSLPRIYKKHRKSADKEIFAYLHYGVNIENPFDSKTAYFKRYYEQTSSGSSKSTFFDVDQHFLTPNKDFDKIRIFKNDIREALEPSIQTADFLQVEISSSENDQEITTFNESMGNEDENSSETSDADEGAGNYVAPRLQRIESKHLLQTKIRRKRTSKCLTENKPTVSKRPKRQIQTIRKSMSNKIICEMYGTKTINYDLVETLPPNVIRSNLSDSSAASSSWQKDLDKPTVLKNIEFNDMNFNAKNLSSTSSSSSSSSSSSCSTCSSMSSDTREASV
ncbi:uncharacterized protein LOC128872994 [Hylaeus volcanicus]|uniref:uncharacterized protein LOC128872994 n=1 Tax=Hylaeus volcanicus TaxID=313075 RepID=UPI0023B7C4FF|nr:uncharacterized protein LOC128872994 [Hylaeus volcanicus]